MTPAPSAALVAIAGMALVTYLVRAAGLAIGRALPSTAFFSAFLRHLGVSVIVALVTSTLAASDVAASVAAVTTLLLALTGRPTAGLMAGMAVAAALRALGR